MAISPQLTDQGDQSRANKEIHPKDLKTGAITVGKTRTDESHDYPKVELPDTDQDPVGQSESKDTAFDAEPELLLQPEIRPVPYDQLVDEVKGIYGGLIIVEAKCVEVDGKQTLAAQERDPAKQTKLTLEQYSALIALDNDSDEVPSRKQISGLV